jgi:hypothetical protein
VTEKSLRTIPKHTHRLYLSWNLVPGPFPEPSVTNKDFLGSFLDAGVWIRTANAAGQLKTLRSPETSPIEKISALAGFYQQAGLQAEDTVSNVIAWSAWAREPSLSIANLLDRVSLRTSRPREQLTDNYFEFVIQKLVSSHKRVDIDVREYASSLLSIPEPDLPAALGIPWKRDPSIKYVPRPQRKSWDSLPHAIKDSLKIHLGPNSQLLASSYNRIKHGPQLIVTGALPAIQARGLPHDGYDAKDPMVTRPTIRLLLDGSRTQETQEEISASQRVAPFLYAEPDNARRWLFQSIMHSANFLSMIGTWIFNHRFPESPRSFGVSDPFLASLVSEQQMHLERTFPRPL